MFFPLVLLAAKLVAGAATAAVVAAVVIIRLPDILAKLRRYKLHDKDIGKLLKEHLDNGNVRIVSSVFSKRPLGIFPRTLRYEETVEGKLDPELERMFGSKDRIEVAV